MKNRNWLKRKYPKTFEEVSEFLNDEQLDEFRKMKFKLGRLTCDKDVHKKGDLIMFKRSNPITDYNYPLHYSIGKCDENYTESGYHSFRMVDGDFTEIDDLNK